MLELRIVSHPDVRTELSSLRSKELNFQPPKYGHFTRQEGWRIDRYRSDLPSEPPGPPVPGGTWEIARRLSEAYEFVDPALIRAFYDPRESLDGRTMLLEVHFWGLRIYAGVRVGGVADDTRLQDGRDARVAAWNYRTLEKHFEAGQIDYEVWKWLDTGEIEFRVIAFSRPAPIAQPILRMGFWFFGRRTQVKFARHACRRMATLTAAALHDDGRGEPAPLVAPDLAIRPDPHKETMLERTVRRVSARIRPRT